MKKLLILSLFLLTQTAIAESVSYQVACPQGGTRSISGDYNLLTGAFDVTTVITDCVNAQGTTRNGEVTSTGTFKVSANGGEASLDAEIVSDTTRINSDSLSTSRQCSRTVSGTYTIETSIFTGTNTNNCSSSGNFYFPILELVAGFEEQESLDIKKP